MPRFRHVIRTALLCFGFALAGCAVAPTSEPIEPIEASKIEAFEEVVTRLGPIVTDTCETFDFVRSCRFKLFVVETEDDVSNAFQTLDGFGRPVVLVTRTLLDELRNEDEIALVLSHEAAHHILNHLGRQKSDAAQGATILANAAERKGGTRQDVRDARRVGAVVGRRLFAQEYELEADALGAVMAREAGFDAINGARFFLRIPDPGKHALNSHPPNALRRATVRDAVLNNRMPEGALEILLPAT
ncbi:MAG: M48 family metalloprotease [Pseudomonadota bacterium]|nr:M48 family metalloprotease [Pseudomonadota bacterium]